MPKGATDCHIHVFGPEADYPLSPSRSYTPAPAAVSELRGQLQAAGISRVVLVQPGVYGHDNSCQLDAAGAIGMTARVVADLTRNEPRDEAKLICANRLITQSGALPGTSQVVALSQRLADRGAHLQVLARSDQLQGVLEWLPHLACDLVIDHLGLPDTSVGGGARHADMLGRLLQSGRVWVKVSGIFRCSQDLQGFHDLSPLVEELRDSALHRLIWGSDWPYADFHRAKPDYLHLLTVLGDWFPEAAQRQALLSDNPARLFNFAA